jgi:hypothetical protein
MEGPLVARPKAMMLESYVEEQVWSSSQMDSLDFKRILTGFYYHMQWVQSKRISLKIYF